MLVLGDCARVAEHPVDVRLATTEAERRPNTHVLLSTFPSGAKLAKEPKGSFREARACPVALQRGI